MQTIKIWKLTPFDFTLKSCKRIELTFLEILRCHNRFEFVISTTGMSTLRMYFDGASRGNPGLAGAGVLILIDGEKFEFHKSLGIATNNEAEYQAIITGLEQIAELRSSYPEISQVEIKGDSQLIIKQLKNEWQVRSENLVPLYNKAQSFLKTLNQGDISTTLDYIPREQNNKADTLANLGADEN